MNIPKGSTLKSTKSLLAIGGAIGTFLVGMDIITVDEWAKLVGSFGTIFGIVYWGEAKEKKKAEKEAEL